MDELWEMGAIALILRYSGDPISEDAAALGRSGDNFEEIVSRFDP
jgi:hypothetical protein